MAEDTARRQRANQEVIEDFRANEGRVGGPYEGLPILLLHTVGARTGRPRINPMMYLADGERFVVFASNAGRHEHPGWYFNLVADPEVTIEVGNRTLSALATVAEPDERRHLYDVQSGLHAGFIGYEASAQRTIPVVILTPHA